jgi:hypothetical protein
MNQENRTNATVSSSRGPLDKATDSADRFVAGMIYCSLLDALVRKDDTLCGEDVDVEASLAVAWLTLSNHFGFEG